MFKFKFHLFAFVLLAGLFGFANFGTADAATYNSSKLADDSAFTNVNAMNVAQIQALLSANGSFLKNYKEGGRTAAQIIYDAAHGHGDASASLNGIDIHNTINPVAILAVLQKEQSLVTMQSKNDGSLNAAMGFACPDSGGCDSKYKGFTKQVENGAWQLRYNYERASGHGFSDFQVGKTVNIDGKKIKLSNRSTAALYRYTPHLSMNFTNYFNKWNKADASNAGKTYNAVFSRQKISTKTIKPGQKVTVTLTYKNTGTAIWYNNIDNSIKLGTQDPQDSNNILLNGDSRVSMRVNSIKKGKKAVFVWTFTAPTQPGTYTVALRPVAEHINWFGPTRTVTIKVAGSGATVAGAADPSNPGGTYGASIYKTKLSKTTAKPGQTVAVTMELKNTGTAIWTNSTNNAVKLGTQNPQDGGSILLSGANRVAMRNTNVRHNKKAVFVWTFTAPTQPGTYTVALRPVAEYITWFGPTRTITLTVK